MDWASYRRLGVGTPFEEKPGRTSAGSGWHWNTVHRPPPPREQPEVESGRRALELRKYPLPPEAHRQPSVPAGAVTHRKGWVCEAFPGTLLDYYVYLPAQFPRGAAQPPAKLLICQDGDGYLDPCGEIRCGVVLDNMVHAGELGPAVVGLFVRPGQPLADVRSGTQSLETDWERSFEYDSITGRYGQMLIDELLPQVEREHGLKLSREPAERIIMGHSSGGVAAMAAGFNHPGHFGCVVSHCASYVNIRGAHQLQWAVRNTLRKPLKVLLLIGTNDNDNDHGNNQLANEQLGAALEYAGYDSQLIIGTGWHNKVHAAHVLPSTLRWMWCGGPKPQALQSRL